jgi:cell division protease FtsH
VLPRYGRKASPSSDGEPSPWRVEGQPERPQRRRATHGRRLPGGRRLWWLVVVLLGVNWWVGSAITDPGHDAIDVSYSEFRKQVRAGNVAEVTSAGETIRGAFRSRGGQEDTGTRFETVRPQFADDRLLDLLERNGVEVRADLEPGPPLWRILLISFGPTLLLLGLFWFLLPRIAGTPRGLGRSRAKRYRPSAPRTTFDEVAGIDDAEDELAEIVDFLGDPERYGRLGAAIPRGVLLTGMPGTGKTLLARAVAGEAEVPFYSLSAAEFIEMVVGVGASRVRDLFKTAKESAPAIIFIDELDAIGRTRGSGMNSGADDEREQTLNQILTEMDGFSGSEGVIVLAATNRPEILDPALLRPGRFDRRIVVSPPDRAGRQRILAVHTRGIPLADDVDIARIAGRTPGMVGADLKNLVNESALMAARRCGNELTEEDFNEAIVKVVLGAERRIRIPDLERARTAYHEAGHALLGMLEPGADPVHKISIVPRGRSLGSTFQVPEQDRYGFDTAYLRGRIAVALGGRAAEELVYGDVTTGAEGDLELVTRLARQMVGRWGMSRRVGLVSVLSENSDQHPFAGSDRGTSEATKELVDTEVRLLLDECYEAALERLRRNRPALDRLANALLEHETLDEREAFEAAGFQRSGRAVPRMLHRITTPMLDKSRNLPTLDRGPK